MVEVIKIAPNLTCIVDERPLRIYFVTRRQCMHVTTVGNFRVNNAKMRRIIQRINMGEIERLPDIFSLLPEGVILASSSKYSMLDM